MRWSMRLTVISGPVSFCLTDAMILDRTSDVRLSTTVALYAVTVHGATTSGVTQVTSKPPRMCRIRRNSFGAAAGVRLGRLLCALRVRWQSSDVVAKELGPKGVADGPARAS